MSRHGYLTGLRAALDNEITYGSQDSALLLAREYLKEAEACGHPGEREYFTGQVRMLEGDYVQAIAHFDRAVGYNPADGAAYNDRALCMVELGIIDESFIYFDRGIAAEEDYATVYHNKGWLLNNIGRHSESLAYFRKALELEPERAVTYDNLADALFNLGDYRGALEAYRKVLALLGEGKRQDIREEVAKKITQLENKLEG